MCHAKTTKGSQLNLDEVDEILSSFFKPAPATTAGRERLLTEDEDGTPVTQTPGDPRNHADSRDRHRKAMPGPWGGSSASGGAGGGRGAAPPEELPAEREDRQTAAGEEAAPARAGDSSPPGGPSHRPPRGNARSRKKIRFTGELGAFLDGEGMWSDVAVMEAERKAEENILPHDRIQHHQEQKQDPDGHGPRGDEEEREQEEAQEQQQQQKEVEEEEEEEEEEAGVVRAKGERGDTRPGGEGKDDGWPAAATGQSESPPCPVVAADPRGSPVSSDPTSTSAGEESPVSLPAPMFTAPAAPAPAPAAVVGGGSAASEEK